MKAYTIKDSQNKYKLDIVDLPDLHLAPDEIRVKWHATSLNFHDYLVATGAIKVDDGRIPMSDGAGEVIEIGDHVTRFKVGDRVMSMFFPSWIEGVPTVDKIRLVSGESVNGFMAEHTVVNEASVTLIPEKYSYSEAAILPTAALTSWNALFENASSGIGQSLLIEGTGGMSLTALAFALATGMDVYATTSSDEKAEILKSLGVKEVINYVNDPGWGKTIAKLSGGGVDQVIDAGGGSTIKQSIEACKMGGHIHSIGILGNGRKGEITFPKLFFKFIKLQGLAVGSRVMQERMVSAIEQQNIDFRFMMDRQFTFDQLPQAFDYQESGQQFGKIILEW